MEIINIFNCKDQYEAKQKEQEYILLLNASLNNAYDSIPFTPYMQPSENIQTTHIISNFFCEECNVPFSTQELKDIHMDMHILSNNLIQDPKYLCECCDYVTSRISQMGRHKMTAKHQKAQKGYKKDIEDIQNVPKNVPKSQNPSVDPKINIFKCNCGKEYNYSSGIWRHKKKCTFISQEITINNEEQLTKIDNSIIHSNSHIDSNLIMEVIKQNQELQNIMIDQNKQILEQNKTIVELAGKVGNNNTINSNNKQFNLQFFLNETCKDAMNIDDFVNSIQIGLSDLESMGKLGYVEGMTKIITDGLKKIGVYEKPFWCTDEKREMLHVKKDNVWEQDDEHTIIHKTIGQIEGKNVMQLNPWRNANPGCMDSDNKKNDIFMQINKYVLGGEPKQEGYPDGKKSCNKIVKNIIKNIIIKK